MVPFACGGFCLWCLLRAWRACVHGVALSLHGVPRIQSCTQHSETELQLSGGVVQICFGFFFLCCIQLSTTSRKFTPLSLTHYFICFVLLPRCFGVALLPRHCFGVACALLRRCLRVASALPRHSLGVPWASALLRRRALQLRCNFGATSAQLWLNNAFGSIKTSRAAAPMLICVLFGLLVVCKTGGCWRHSTRSAFSTMNDITTPVSRFIGLSQSCRSTFIQHCRH